MCGGGRVVVPHSGRMSVFVRCGCWCICVRAARGLLVDEVWRIYLVVNTHPDRNGGPPAPLAVSS